MSKLWIPDNKTYNELQQLKTFVDFVAGLKNATKDDKETAIKIKTLIENFNQPDTFENWNVCLDIFDRNVQYGINKNGGVYQRKWWAFFEENILEIEAATKHIDDPLNHFGNDFHFVSYIDFNKNIPYERRYTNGKLIDFIKDVEKFKSYMTETLNDIEIDIAVF